MHNLYSMTVFGGSCTLKRTPHKEAIQHLDSYLCEGFK